MNIEEHRYYANAVRDVRIGYWTALLTINGILIAVFSYTLFQNLSNQWLSLILIICSVVCSYLLIKNFKTYIEMYEFLGTLQNLNELTEEVKKDETDKSQRRYADVKSREETAERLLFVEAFLIVLIVVSQMLPSSR